MTQTVEEFINHHGVKGMHWGIRNAKNRVKVGKKSTTRTRFDKAPKRLTNAELDARIRRMEMEKKYNDLNRRDVSKGTQVATHILGTSGKKVAITVVTGTGLLVAKKVLEKKVGKEAANMITKRGK